MNVANSSSLSQRAKQNVSAYAVGTDRVTEDQLAYLHKDETDVSNTMLNPIGKEAKLALVQVL